jgi:hypothetical protein
MHRLLPFVFVAALSFVAEAQYFTIDFSGFQTQPCFSGEGTVTTFNSLFVYQTVNDLWDGDLDSTACIDLLQHPINSRAYLDVADAHPNRPIFIKKVFNQPLWPNSAFNIFADQYYWGSQVFSDCSSLQMCSGIYFNIRVPAHPDSLEPYRTDHRFLPFEYEPSGQWSDPTHRIGQCLPTEHFEDQQLESIVWMISPSGEPENQPITLFNVEWFVDWNMFLTVSPHEASAFDYNFANATHTYSYFDWAAILFGRTAAEGYPAVDNVHYIDVLPNAGGNVTTQESIVIRPYDENYSTSLTFQPYTALRGALVEGETALRHNLEIVFPSYTMCQSLIGDYVVEPNVTYALKSNHIDLSNTGCLLFKWGAHLKVTQGSYVQYSRSGDGMLGLMAGSDIVLERNATLDIGCAVGLWDDPNADGVSVCEIYLHPNSSLRFMAGSSIRNATSGERMKLRVHMLGGIADLADLPAADLRHFEFIYPEAPEGMAIEVLGEARHGQVNLRWWGLSDDFAVVKVFDLNGRMGSSDRIQQYPGWNYTTVATPTAANGLMVVQIATSTRQGAKKFYMQR